MKRQTKQARYKITVVPLKNSDVKIYASPKVASALAELARDLTFYQGVRFSEIVDAVYEQGKKDGARAAFTAVDTQVIEARKLIPHRLPGRPRKSR